MIIITSNKKDSRFNNLIDPPSNDSSFIINARKLNKEFSIILNNPLVVYPNLILTINDIRGNLTPILTNTPSKLVGDINGTNINWYSSDVTMVLNYCGTTLLPFNLYEHGIIIIPVMFDGLVASVVLNTTPVSYISADGHSGSNLHNTIQTSKLVDVAQFDGTHSTTSFNTYLSYDVGYVNMYSGSVSTVTINTYKLLGFGLYDSSSISTILNTYLGINFGILQSYSGESISVDLITFKLLEFNYVYGDNCFIELTENLQFQIQSNMFSGDVLHCGLQIVPVITLDNIYNGSNIDVTIKDAKSIQLNLSDIYTGSTINVTMVTSLLIGFNFHCGSIEYFTLTENKSIPTQISPINDGANGSVQLMCNRLFQSSYYGGSINYVDTLTTIINTGIEFPIWCSELVYVDKLITYSRLYPIASSDNIVTIGLSTTYILGLNGINCGDTLTIDLIASGPPTFNFTNYYGGLVNCSIYSISKLGGFQYNGSTFNLTLNTHESNHLSFSAHCGQVSTIIQPEIKLNYNYLGEVLQIVALDNEQLWRFRCGDIFTLSSFITSATLDCSIATGSMCTLSVQINPSEGIGTFNGYGGEFTGIPLRTMIHQTISVTFKNEVLTTLDIDSAVYFDLITDSCCNKRPLNGQNSYIIELDNAEYPDEVFYGNIVKYLVALSVSPTIQLQMYNGSNLSYIDKTKYFNIEFSDGNNVNINSFEAIVRNRLCNGYFIPSGGSVVTELTEVISEECNSDMGYMGETLICKLTPMAIFQIESQFVVSNRLEVEFTTYRNIPWDFIAYSGETILRITEFVRMSTFEPAITFEHGSVITMSFPEPHLLGYSGECNSFTLTTSKISIEFIDTGCLVNEYQFVDELGNIIPDQYVSVALELYPFEHQLKLKPRCVF